MTQQIMSIMPEPLRQQDAGDVATREMRRAYADQDDSKTLEEAESIRQLQFLSTVTLSPAHARQIASQTIGPCYNDFTPAVLMSLDPESRVRLARESSVCVYVTLPCGKTIRESFAKQMMRAKEFSLHQIEPDGSNTYRIWWD